MLQPLQFWNTRRESRQKQTKEIEYLERETRPKLAYNTEAQSEQVSIILTSAAIVIVESLAQVGVAVRKAAEQPREWAKFGETAVRPSHNAHGVPQVTGSKESRHHRRLSWHDLPRLVHLSALHNVVHLRRRVCAQGDIEVSCRDAHS